MKLEIAENKQVNLITKEKCKCWISFSNDIDIDNLIHQI